MRGILDIYAQTFLNCQQEIKECMHLKKIIGEGEEEEEGRISQYF